MIPAPMFSVSFHLPFANAAYHLIFTSHQLFAPTIHAFPSLSIYRHISISSRIPARRLTSLKLFQNLRSLFPTPAPTLRNQSALLKHLTYPSVALHVPDVVPLPRHHERVHRHLPAQPRREASRSVRAASCGQCFWNPVHVLSPIKTKRRHSECSGARARLRSTGMHNTLVIRFTYCLYRSIPFFSSINFPSKISCSTCLHGIRCNLLTSDASITRKVVW